MERDDPNAVWKDIASGDEGLVVYRAADACISPTSYPSKHKRHRHVPPRGTTWWRASMARDTARRRALPASARAGRRTEQLPTTERVK